MIPLILIAIAVAVAALILKVIVPFVASPAVLSRLGPFRAGLLGIVICGALALAGFAIADLDHVAASADPKVWFWDAAQLAGFSATYWLPVYLFGFWQARRSAGAGT